MRVTRWWRVAFLAAVLTGTAACSRTDAPEEDRNPKATQDVPANGGVDDPESWVSGLYLGETGPGLPDFELYSEIGAFSPSLRAALREDEAYANGEIGRLEINPFTGAQDDEITDLEVTSEAVEGNAGRQAVTARFRNMGQPATLRYYFVQLGDRWFVDDIARIDESGEYARYDWMLSKIVTYGS